MTMLKTLASAIALTGTAIGPAIRCNVTPFTGGWSRNALLNIDAAPGGAAVVKIQGNPLAGSVAPASGDAGWVDIVTLNSASPLSQEIAIPTWIRYNITTLGTGTLNARLEGVQ